MENVRVILTPAEIARAPDLRGSVCVVFDVLRATSTIVTALANGAARVFPAATIEEAREWKQARLPHALLGGERKGVRIQGFDLGNSPREYTRETVAGRDIITTTTNGTIALRACAGASAVYAGSLLNLRVLADHLHATPSTALVIVCAGSGSMFSLEDALGAGALLEVLDAQGDDATAAVRAVYGRFSASIREAIQRSYNGRVLASIGLQADVEWCGRESILKTVVKGSVESECGLLCFSALT